MSEGVSGLDPGGGRLMKVGRDVCAMLNSVCEGENRGVGGRCSSRVASRGSRGDVLIQTGGVLWLKQLSLVKDSFVDAQGKRYSSRVG